MAMLEGYSTMKNNHHNIFGCAIYFDKLPENGWELVEQKKNMPPTLQWHVAGQLKSDHRYTVTRLPFRQMNNATPPMRSR